MATIKAVSTPWRKRWKQASFRGAKFFVETGTVAGGRRVALHQYPKRSVPYAEDMGKQAQKFTVNGYLIGPNYLDAKNTLITALEKDGPAMLRLPTMYLARDVNVMVNGYSVSESREKGGFCEVQMDFVEYGNPSYRASTSTPASIESSAANTESTMVGTPTADTATQAQPYVNVGVDANANSGVSASPDVGSSGDGFSAGASV